MCMFATCTLRIMLIRMRMHILNTITTNTKPSKNINT